MSPETKEIRQSKVLSSTVIEGVPHLWYVDENGDYNLIMTEKAVLVNDES